MTLIEITLIIVFTKVVKLVKQADAKYTFKIDRGNSIYSTLSIFIAFL